MVLRRIFLCTIFVFYSIAAKSITQLDFEDYSVPVEVQVKITPPVFSAKTTPSIQEATTDALTSGKPNFAGHYRVVMTGCGTGCVQGLVYDMPTGRMIEFPFTINCKDPNYFAPIDFKLDSSLIVFKGSKEADGSGNGEYYYQLKDNRLVPVATIPLPEPTGPPQVWDGKEGLMPP